MFRGKTIFGAFLIFALIAITTQAAQPPADLPRFGDGLLTWSGKVRVALQTDPGHAYAIQESADMQTWTTLPGDPIVASLLTFPATNTIRFYRAIRVATNPDYIPAPVVLPTARTNFAATALRLWTEATQAETLVNLWGNGTFTVGDRALGIQRGTYFNLSYGLHAQVWLNSSDPPYPLRLIEMEFIDANSGISRAWIAGPSIIETTGSFNVEPLPAQVLPPPTLSRLIVNLASSGFGPAQFTINLSGGASGSFTITEGSVGQGVYTYTAGETSARLFLTYSDFPGDTDDFTLTFLPIGSHRIEGTQVINRKSFRAEGSFTYLP